MSSDRILVWGLSNNRAGTEHVIDTYCRASPSAKFDFLCYEAPVNYEHLFASGDNRYYVIPIKIKHPIAYERALRSFVKDHIDEYKMIWCNINDISNIDILSAARNVMNIPIRCVHMHSSSIPDVPVTKLFSFLNRKKLFKVANQFWACSHSAGDFLYSSYDYEVIPNLVDDKHVSFSEEKRNLVRSHYGIENSLVIGNVGRLTEVKNQSHLIKLLHMLVSSGRDAVLMLVGEGELEGKLRDYADGLGLGSRVIFTGGQSDVQAYYSAMDVAAFPSLFEGLSIAILEAQFNGLPCVLSSGISSEVCISSSCDFVDLDNLAEWQNCILNATRERQLLLPAADAFRCARASVLAGKMFN